MTNVGPISKWPFLLKVYNAIWEAKQQKRQDGSYTFEVNGETLKVGKFAKSQCYYVKHKGILFVEQNTNSQSGYAASARKGSKILWIIKDGISREENGYLGRLQDGIHYRRMKEQQV